MSNIAFSPEELSRYSRHIIIPEFNLEGQKKLKAAKVLVIGSGGLGSPLLLYLAAAGVGTIGIVDFDTIDDSNLQRQILFTTNDVGKLKATTAAERIKALNPFIEVIVHNTQLNSQNALDIIKDYDVVADGTDNFPTRYLVNDACVLLDKVNVYASIYRFEGQLSVFNLPLPDGTRGPNYRDLFPEPPPPGLVPSCAEGGVLGVLPGILGSLQAAEVIKVISNVGEPLSGRLFTIDVADFQTRTLKIHKQESTKIEKLIDYELFCGLKNENMSSEVKEITVGQLAEWIDSGKEFQLIDVREPHEYAIAEIGGILIPLAQISEHADRISLEKPVVIHCRSGVRSAKAIRELQELHGWDHLYNLKGGILAWADEIDQLVTKY
ncbi:MAG: molybdopterin-synthase adenylyltransferase MoeB [Saprospiraceae bacterium]|nr:molybdopterin-synthase adenylyltransferase MoeB [Saprospiraceae bacterium]